jgi:FKBP-type peptidyl-prolyl cis-trans isomerase FklB
MSDTRHSSHFQRKDSSLKSSISILVVLLLLPLVLIGQQKESLQTMKGKVSYSIGLDIGRNMKRQMIEVDLDLLMRGVKDGLGDGKAALSDSVIQATMAAWQKDMMAKMNEVQKKAGEKNKKEGDAFLAENKKKPGVITLPSGLQYKILKDGTGKSPKATDTVVVHYRGTLTNGKEFESSYKRGQPAIMPVNQFIAGWIEALQKMKAGSKWQLFIPPNLGYGENGAGQDIGPNATLIFEVELVDIKK